MSEEERKCEDCVHTWECFRNAQELMNPKDCSDYRERDTGRDMGKCEGE